MASSDFLVLPVAIPQTLISCGYIRDRFFLSVAQTGCSLQSGPVLRPVWHPRPLLCMQAGQGAGGYVHQHTHPHTCLQSPALQAARGPLGSVAVFSFAGTSASVAADGMEPLLSPGKAEVFTCDWILLSSVFLHSPSSPVHLWSHNESYALSGSNAIRQSVNWPGESLLLPGLLDGSSACSMGALPFKFGLC